MKNTNHIVEKYLPGSLSTTVGNAQIIPTDARDIHAAVAALIKKGLPLLTMFATDERTKHNVFCIYYVFGVPYENLFIVPTISITGTSFPSLAADFPRFAQYEREIMTMFGLQAEGHPDPRSITLHEENWPEGQYPLRKDFEWNSVVSHAHTGDYVFQRVGGEGMYEIPVGPVHAGIIEPGHFRFSQAGEEIVALEARFGWTHKGVEKLFEQLPLDKKVTLSEKISGDSAFSHSLAFCEALEKLTNTKVPHRAQFLRTIFGELERITMHLFDIGNIAGNGAGFTFMSAQGFRMVENLRRLSETLSGNRFLRGLNTPGGITKDIAPEHSQKVLDFLAILKKDFSDIVHIAKGSISLANRLDDTGVVPSRVVQDYGAVGIAARSANIMKDARVEYPYAAYDEIVPEVALTEGNDVSARFYLRIKEVYASIALIEKALEKIPSGSIHTHLHALPKDAIGISAVEGWRGEIVYAIVVQDGAITRVKVRDPSFIHWQLFAHLSSSDMVPDFPLINKSFNLSYSGNDL